MKNQSRIALIGMPGCGKSTIGKLLRKEMKLDLIDLDEYIVEYEKKSIEELFNLGEDNFRDCETRALKDISEVENIIVSTGGGIIKRKENNKLLKEKFTVVFIDRPVNHICQDIDTDSRPLLKKNIDALSSLYEERYKLYLDVCNIHILNNSSIEKVISKIITEVKEYTTF